MNRYLLIPFVMLFAMSCSKSTSTESALSSDSDLKVGVPVERTLKPHMADTFKLNLKNKAFVTGQADQLSVDVEMTITGPDMEPLTIDGPNRGPDKFYFTASTPGDYQIVVSPFKEAEGKYIMSLNDAITLSNDPATFVDQVAGAIVGKGKVPGAAIAVVQDDKIIFSKGFGYADLESGVAITPKTIFHIASVSKQFTSFAIATLADQGKISMNDDIRKYLPEMHDFGTPITINHLVHHTSGLRDQWNLLALAGWRLDDVITKNQIMRLISRQTALNFKPGEEYYYCNTGFTLMAEIVSRVSGKSFPEWTQENIFQPLHMDNTLFYDDHEKIVPNRAYSYHPTPDGFKKSVLSYANAGATSLFTTVEDLSLWAVNFEKMTVGNDRVMKMMNERFVLNKGDTIKYAFGQVIDKYKGLNIISHSGGDAGYRTFLLRFPDQRFDVIVFSNLASFNPVRLSYTIADNYLANKLQKEEKKKETPPAPAEEVPFDTKSVNLNDFLGTFYSDELQTMYTFSVVNDTLTAKHQRHDDIKLVPKKKDTFEASAWFMGDVTFERDAKQKVNGLKVNAGRIRNVDFRKH